MTDFKPGDKVRRIKEGGIHEIGEIAVVDSNSFLSSTFLDFGSAGSAHAEFYELVKDQSAIPKLEHQFTISISDNGATFEYNSSDDVMLAIEHLVENGVSFRVNHHVEVAENEEAEVSP